MTRFLIALLAATIPLSATAKLFECDADALSWPSSDGAQEARMNVFRTRSIPGWGHPFLVKVGWKKAATLPGPMTYSSFSLPEGVHKLTFSCAGNCVLRSVQLRCALSGGREYAFLMDPASKYSKGVMFDFSIYTSTVRQISREDSLELMKTYKEVKSD